MNDIKFTVTDCLDIMHHYVFYLKHNVSEILISSKNWAQLSRFHLKTETESSLRHDVF
jgi:hypothetical protein